MLTLCILEKSLATLRTSSIAGKVGWNSPQGFQAGLILLLSLVSLFGYVEPIPAAEAEFVNVAGTEDTFAGVKLVDAALIDQDGRPVKFSSQVVSDRIVAINFIYTTCSTVCPLVSATFKRLQDKLGDRLGRDVWLVSISLDPVTDTPARLKEYAARYHAKPGWLWLTGDAMDVEQVLNGLGTTSANFREHAPLTLVGDGKRGRWVRFNALTGPQQISAELDGLLVTRKPESKLR